MAYSKAMAEQNRQLLARAKTLLLEAGYSYENELAHDDFSSGSYRNPYIGDMNRKVSKILAEEYRHLNPERVNRRVAQAMGVLRREQKKEA